MAEALSSTSIRTNSYLPGAGSLPAMSASNKKPRAEVRGILHDPRARYGLSERQYAVAILAAAGVSNQEIAARLFITRVSCVAGAIRRYALCGSSGLRYVVTVVRLIGSGSWDSVSRAGWYRLACAARR